MKNIFLCLGLSVVLAGCSYQPQQHILKEDLMSNSRIFDASRDTVYQAFIKTVLMKNFMIVQENAEAGSVLAERSVERGRRTYSVSVQARIFEETPGQSSLFLNGTERCERAYVRDNTRFFLFVIPLPGGGGKEATSVTEHVRPIRDESFYNDIFFMVDTHTAQAFSGQTQKGTFGVASF